MENFWTWSLQGYINIVGFFFWPIILASIIGYIYLKNQSIVAASIAILIFIGAFASTNIFIHVSSFVMILQIIVALAFTGLVVIFLTKWR